MAAAGQGRAAELPLRVDLTGSAGHRRMTGICAFLPSRGAHTAAPSRSGVCVFPLLNGGREPQRGSAHAADLSPTVVSHAPQGPPREGLAAEVASSSLNAERASSRKLRMRARIALRSAMASRV